MIKGRLKRAIINEMAKKDGRRKYGYYSQACRTEELAQCPGRILIKGKSDLTEKERKSIVSSVRRALNELKKDGYIKKINTQGKHGYNRFPELGKEKYRIHSWVREEDHEQAKRWEGALWELTEKGLLEAKKINDAYREEFNEVTKYLALKYGMV